jgi:hypothetical protein
MAKKPDTKAEEVKKIKNPMIKLAPEAEFTKRSDPFFTAALAKCEVGKIWFTKEVCQLFWEGALDRDLVPDVWNPLWELLPKLKNEATGTLDVIEPAVAKKRVLDRGIEIGMVYSRMRTALEINWPVCAKPEADLLDFFVNDHLSDVSIIHPSTEAVYR